MDVLKDNKKMVGFGLCFLFFLAGVLLLASYADALAKIGQLSGYFGNAPTEFYVECAIGIVIGVGLMGSAGINAYRLAQFGSEEKIFITFGTAASLGGGFYFIAGVNAAIMISGYGSLPGSYIAMIIFGVISFIANFALSASSKVSALQEKGKIIYIIGAIGSVISAICMMAGSEGGMQGLPAAAHSFVLIASLIGILGAFAFDNSGVSGAVRHVRPNTSTGYTAHTSTSNPNDPFAQQHSNDPFTERPGTYQNNNSNNNSNNGSTSDVSTELKKLKDLKDAGILTEEEYNAKRQKYIDRL